MEELDKFPFSEQKQTKLSIQANTEAKKVK